MQVRRWLPLLFAVTVFAVAAWVLNRQLADVRWVDVEAQLRAVDATTLLAAVGCCLASFIALAVHEVAAVRQATRDEPAPRCTPRRSFITALIAYPIGHAVGVGALSGGAVRLRLYSAAGLSLAQVGQVVVLCLLPYGAGLGVLFAGALLLHREEAGALLHLTPLLATVVAATLLLVHGGYITATFRLRGAARLPRWLGGSTVALPPGRLTLLQYAVGIVDVCGAAAILWLFLPDSAGLGFAAFLPVYVLCILAAIASNVPAGLGVFEAILIGLLPQVPKDALFGAVLLYRCVFELLPLAWALLLFAGAEAAGKGRDVEVSNRGSSVPR